MLYHWAPLSKWTCHSFVFSFLRSSLKSTKVTFFFLLVSLPNFYLNRGTGDEREYFFSVLCCFIREIISNRLLKSLKTSSVLTSSLTCTSRGTACRRWRKSLANNSKLDGCSKTKQLRYLFWSLVRSFFFYTYQLVTQFYKDHFFLIPFLVIALPFLWTVFVLFFFFNMWLKQMLDKYVKITANEEIGWVAFG